MEEQYLGNQGLAEWRESTDEQHVQELFRNKGMVNPFYMAYLKDERPATITSYLQMWQADGRYVSPIAKKWLKGKR